MIINLIFFNYKYFVDDNVGGRVHKQPYAAYTLNRAYEIAIFPKATYIPLICTCVYRQHLVRVQKYVYMRMYKSIHIV